MRGFLNRMREPSTWAGLAGMLVSTAHFIGKPEAGDAIGQVIGQVAEPAAHGDWLHALIAGVSAVAVLRGERGGARSGRGK